MSSELVRVRGIGPAVATRLNKAGVNTIDQLADSRPEELAFVKGIGIISAKKMIDNARHLMTLERGLTIVLDHVKRSFEKSCPKCGGDMRDKYIILSPTRRLNARQCTICNFYLPKS